MPLCVPQRNRVLLHPSTLSPPTHSGQELDWSTISAPRGSMEDSLTTIHDPTQPSQGTKEAPWRQRNSAWA